MSRTSLLQAFGLQEGELAELVQLFDEEEEPAEEEEGRDEWEFDNTVSDDSPPLF